ncbi:type IV pilin [Halomicrobium katesii]|uniref:type IV pilin n=1 Tax=Halomicrobium katesii TaxID=437163 RepID=UPI000379F231|nr:type IV pilin N-terminal domain-containing protein [Halomicrobium katesii]
MDLKQLFNDDDAVSPVIGVILMVAITVILAAVIASFVLGLGDQTNTTPTASFSFDYDSDASSVKITHGGGDPIQADELYIRGTGGSGGTTDIDQTWADKSSLGTSSDVTAGNSVTYVSSDIGSNGDWDLSVVYVSNEGDSSASLSSDSGPNA